jgi:hypothetical protein
MKKRQLFARAFKNFFRIDKIRISKLLEIGQFTVLSFILGFVGGSFLNAHVPQLQFDDDPKQSASELIAEILLDVFLIAISLYYSHKILDMVRDNIPFLFSLDKKYIPCMKGECLRGVAVGFSLSYIASMKNFYKKVNKLRDKFFGSENNDGDEEEVPHDFFNLFHSRKKPSD